MCSQAHSQQPPVTWDNCPAFKYLASGAEHDSKLLPPLMLEKLIYKVRTAAASTSGRADGLNSHGSILHAMTVNKPGRLTPNNIN